MHAYLDESARLSGAGLYVVAAVVVPPTSAGDVRAQLRACLPPRQVRFHWYEEKAALRRRVVSGIVTFGLPVLAVATSPLDRRKTERARRLCLLRLLWELERRNVRTVTIESRRKRDAADRQVIAAARRTGQVSPHLRYEFGLPTAECLLWLADAAAGAVRLGLADADSTYLDLLGATASVITVP